MPEEHQERLILSMSNDPSDAIVLLEELPKSTYELIDYLVVAYPPRCIRVGETAEEAQRYAGMVELVTHLADLKQVDQEPDYDDEPAD